MTTIKFLWNGIKVNGGSLQRASYSTGRLIGYPEGTITIYGKRYNRFSAEVCEALAVQNDTDYMTDYFENDRIRVVPGHPLYSAVLAAAEASEAHSDKMRAKREQRWIERRTLATA